MLVLALLVVVVVTVVGEDNLDDCDESTAAGRCRLGKGASERLSEICTTHDLPSADELPSGRF